MAAMRPAGGVADDVDVPVAGPEARRQVEEAAVGGAAPDAGLVEVERLDIGNALVGDADVRDVEPRFLAVRGDDAADALAARLDRRDRGRGTDVDALLAQAVEDDPGELGIEAGEGLAGIDDRHLRAEPAIGLGDLEPDGIGADNEQVGQPAGIVEDGLGGEEGNAVEPGDRGDGGTGAGGDDDVPGADLDVARRDRAGVEEAGIGLDDLHAERLQAGDRVAGRQRRDDLLDAVVELACVDARRLGSDAEGRAGAHGLGVGGGRRQHARRHGAGIEIAAAHAVALDEHGARAQGARLGGGGQPAQTGADDAQVRRDGFRQVSPLPSSRMPPPCRHCGVA